MTSEPPQAPSHQLQNTAFPFVWHDTVPSTSDECRQQEDQSDALSSTLTSNIDDTENTDEKEDNLSCSLLSRYSCDVDHNTLSGTGEMLRAQRSDDNTSCLLYTSPSPRDGLLSRMPSSA